MPGYFITIEGIDGCGKTTLAESLIEYLRPKPVVFSDLGSTSMGRMTRNLITKDFMDEVHEDSFFDMIRIARKENIDNNINPALKKNKTVICDRWQDSTYAYQGKIPVIPDCPQPDLTFYITFPYHLMVSRKHKNRDRIESRSQEYYDQVLGRYDEIVNDPENASRVVKINGCTSKDTILDKALSEINKRKSLKRMYK